LLDTAVFTEGAVVTNSSGNLLLQVLPSILLCILYLYPSSVYLLSLVQWPNDCYKRKCRKFVHFIPTLHLYGAV